MTEFLQFLLDHGYVVIFCWVALDQAGLPLPTLPLLLAAGALAGTGELSLLGFSSSVHWLRYQLTCFGSGSGVFVVFVCCIFWCILSLEPDYCVRDTEALFKKLGPLSVVLAKFVPGLTDTRAANVGSYGYEYAGISFP